MILGNENILAEYSNLGKTGVSANTHIEDCYKRDDLNNIFKKMKSPPLGKKNSYALNYRFSYNKKSWIMSF